MSDKNGKKVVVIGGGPGGYGAAFMAADLGMDTTLIDPEENPGGVCLYRGCIPSKALLHVSKLIEESKESKNWGVTFESPDIDIEKMRSWKNDVVAKLTGGLGQLSKQRKVTHLRGTAQFKDNKSLEVDLVDGDKKNVTFDYAIIATGSEIVYLPDTPDSDRILDSTSALDIEDVPKSLLVVGGGYIGLEMGTVYASLGSKVTVVEMGERILPGVDRDLTQVLKKRLDGLFDSIQLNVKVTEMKAQKNGVKVTLQDSDGQTSERRFEKVLVAIGRKPTSKGIGLENTRIETDDRGFIKTDAQRRTAEEHIFAIGDVAGEPMLAHKATHEGRLAAEVIDGKKAAFEPRAIPAVVFTDPEVAWCGLTEEEAKQKGVDIAVSKFPWAASGRAITLGRSDGLTKLIVDPESERLLGMGVVGPGAGELIAEGVVAIEMAARVEDVGLSIHPHPTLSETIMEAADVFFGHSAHYYRRKR